MGILKMAETIKKVHPESLVLFKSGNFVQTFGKDSYIISSIFDYTIKTKENIHICGFPKKIMRKSISKIRRQKNKLHYSRPKK